MSTVDIKPLWRDVSYPLSTQGKNSLLVESPDISSLKNKIDIFKGDYLEINFEERLEQIKDSWALLKEHELSRNKILE